MTIKVWQLLVVVMVIATGVVLIESQPTQAPYARTLETCQSAHDNHTSVTECGKLQDQTHTEFICNAQNTQCWLELK